MLAAALGAAIGLGFFDVLLGFDLLDPHASFWRNPTNDLSTMIAGYEAILREGWSLQPAVTSRLTGTPLSIVYTDSIPWLTLLLKALGVGHATNNVAVFLLASFVLQPVSMMLLLRACGVQRLGPLFVGGALALLLPAWMIRFPHVALSGHWILLLALALAVSAIRHGLTVRHAGGFVALGTLITGVHAYHLAPFAACLAAALSAELISEGARAGKRVVLTGLAVTAGVGASAWLLGYGYGLGAIDGVAELGKYSMNLIGPIMPQASALAGQVWNGSWFTGTIDPSGAQSFEGFSYLGAGILIMLVTAALLLVEKGVRLDLRDRQVVAFAPLGVLLLALTVWAIGPTIYLGPKLVAELPKPDWLAPLGVFRAHGRFFWLVAYALLAGGIVALERLASHRTSHIVLAAALTLQLFDTGPVRTGVQAMFESPARSPMPASFIREPALRGRTWVVAPTFYCAASTLDRLAIAQIVLTAIRLDGATNTAITARPPGTPCVTPPHIGETARAGDHRLTVLLNDGKAFGGALDAAASRTDCYRFTDGLLCGRGLQNIAGLEPLKPRGLAKHNVVQTFVFDGGSSTSSMLLSGWAVPAPSGVWSLGREATLAVPTDHLPTGKDLVFEFQAMSFAPPPRTEQVVHVLVNGRPSATWHVAAAIYRANTIVIRQPHGKGADPVRITFVTPEASAAKAGEPPLGIGLEKLTIFD